ncbi:MAG: hypothetical protein JWL73_2294 [Actinomycetia bacterium]|jgi:hypothetical protein|nr:hypothetical protein [Actinomycetes bacterium]
MDRMRAREWQVRKLNQKKTGNDAVIAAMQSELALLRDENAQLRLERQQHATPAVSAGRLTSLVDAMSRGVDAEEAEWSALSEALVLRESLVSVCDELERTIGAVRRQLQTETPSPELDRRRTDRRRAISGGLSGLDFGTDTRGTAAIYP